MRYIVDIRPSTDTYKCVARVEPSAGKPRMFKAALCPQSEVVIKGARYTLAGLINILLDYNEDDLRKVFDEAGQAAVGRYLYEQIFGELDQRERKTLRGTDIELIIVTPDEHVARLPWILLNDDGIFLCARGWSVSLNGSDDFSATELPSSPRILIAAPQPDNLDPTDAELHLKSLKELLINANPRFSKEQNLQVVRAWEEFREVVDNLKPDVVYFYGHGDGDLHTSRLLFTERQGDMSVSIPVADVANCLSNQPGGPPRLVYFNCCYGDSGGILGVGMQLREFVPAVITNFTAANIKVAQIQAQTLLTHILLEGKAPHVGVAEMRRKLVGGKLSFKEMHWMNLVLHRGYSNWVSTPPKPQSRLARDSYWQLKLDRVNQFSRVYFDTKTMLTDRSPRSLAYLWYGAEGQGQNLFHRRLSIELKGEFASVMPYEVSPEWPQQFSNPNKSFEDMMAEAFNVQSVGEIPSRIRGDVRHSSQQLLIYVRHQPIVKSGHVTVDLIKDYISWWDEFFVAELDAHMFSLLGVSFEVEKDKPFRKILSDKGFDDLNYILRNTTFITLDELTRLNENDLLHFIQKYKIPVPRAQMSDVVKNVLSSTGGDYEKTLEVMKNVERGGWLEYVSDDD